MTEQQVVAFLKALNAHKIKPKSNGWVEACCPLAPWLHEKKHDHTPSFGVRVVPGGQSYFQCFACQSGAVEKLLQTLEFLTKNTGPYDFKTARALLDDELSVVPLPEYEEFGNQPQPFEEWPSYWVESFTPFQFIEEAVQYLKGRENPANLCTLQACGVRWDPYRHMLVAPYWNVFGKLAGARGRSVLPDTSGPNKHFDYRWNGRNNAKLCWYNEPCLQLPGPVVVVEGQFDCWRTLEAYPKVVANLTAKPSWEKMQKLSDSEVVIQIPDNDQTGHESVDVYAAYCASMHVQHRVLRLDVSVKDPDLCHPDYLRDRIQELL